MLTLLSLGWRIQQFSLRGYVSGFRGSDEPDSSGLMGSAMRGETQLAPRAQVDLSDSEAVIDFRY